MLSDSTVAVLAQSSPALHIFDRNGELIHAWGNDLHGAHGLTRVVEEGTEYLWITDQDSGQVTKHDLQGDIHQRIAPPAEDEGEYSPTWVAIAPVTRDIWVADGYGCNVIRRYSSEGTYKGKLTGEEGPGRFARPHGIAFHPNGTLYIADRRNRRILVYDENGRYLFHRDHVTHSPCGFAICGELLYVPELFGDLKVLDISLDLHSSYGTNFDVRPEHGWPEQQGWGWPELRNWPDELDPLHIQPNAFIAPHAVALAPDNTIYLVEWVRGGRITRGSPMI